MIKKINKIFLILISITLIFSTNYVLALENPDVFDPRNETSPESQGIIAKAGPVLGAIRNVGIIIAVITLAIIGVKYMFCSIAEKAEYKKTMLPYVIGCFLLMSISAVLTIIEAINL